MNNEFLRNILFVISINLVIKPVYIFGIDRTVQNLVGTETYGVYFALLNLTWLLQIVNDLGLQNYNNRTISQNRHLVQKYLPRIIGIKWWLGIVYAGMTFILALSLGYTQDLFYLLFLLMGNQILISLLFYLRSNLSGLGFFRLDSLLSGLDKFLMVFFCGLLLVQSSLRASFRIEWLVYCQTISYLVTVLIALYFLREKFSTFIRIRLKLAEVLVILKKSFPYALIVLLMTAYTRIDGIMLERLLPDDGREAGIYASAYRLLDAANMIGYLFAGLLLPMFARMLQKAEPVKPLVRLGFRLIWPGAVALSSAVFFFRVEIMELLYEGADSYWGDVLGWLIFSFVAVAVSYIFGTLLTAHGSLKQLNTYFLVGFFLNLGLNFWLIPSFGAAGAAIATLFTQGFVMIAQVYRAEKTFPDLVDRKFLGSALLLSLAIGWATYYTYYFLPIEWPFRLLISFFLGMLIAMAFRWWRFQDFKSMVAFK